MADPVLPPELKKRIETLRDEFMAEGGRITAHVDRADPDQVALASRELDQLQARFQVKFADALTDGLVKMAIENIAAQFFGDVLGGGAFATGAVVSPSSVPAAFVGESASEQFAAPDTIRKK